MTALFVRREPKSLRRGWSHRFGLRVPIFGRGRPRLRNLWPASCRRSRYRQLVRCDGRHQPPPPPGTSYHSSHTGTTAWMRRQDALRIPDVCSLGEVIDIQTVCYLRTASPHCGCGSERQRDASLQSLALSRLSTPERAIHESGLRSSSPRKLRSSRSVDRWGCVSSRVPFCRRCSSTVSPQAKHLPKQA